VRRGAWHKDSCRGGGAPVLNNRYLKGRQQRHRVKIRRANGQQACAAVSGARYATLGARNAARSASLREHVRHYEAREQLQHLRRRVGGQHVVNSCALPAAWHPLPHSQVQRRPRLQRDCCSCEFLTTAERHKGKHASLGPAAPLEDARYLGGEFPALSQHRQRQLYSHRIAAVALPAES
jgi:NADH:ubiquinone oxidoreductase subunit